jgi:hypothetical protein
MPAHANEVELHLRLGALVEKHFGSRPTMSADELLDVLEAELSKVAPTDVRTASTESEERPRASEPTDADREQARLLDFELRSWVEVPTSEQRIRFFAEELASARTRHKDGV